MAHDKARTLEKLEALWKHSGVRELPIEDASYAVISDLHMGDGGSADDFRDNETAMKRALEHYREEGYTLVILGDLEEMWQFDLEEILGRYEKSIYAGIRAFGDERVIRVFGNHDSEWYRPVDPVYTQMTEIPGADEALRLVDASGRARVLLVHGHQGSDTSDKKAWSSRFWVRVFRKVESAAEAIGVDPDPSLPRSEIKKDYEEAFHDWAAEHKAILICGHSHRAAFASKSFATRLREERNLLWDAIRKVQSMEGDTTLITGYRKRIEEITEELGDEGEKNRDFKTLGRNPPPCYFNTGCGLYSSGPTAVEIVAGEIRLVRWKRKVSSGGGRQELQKRDLANCFSTIEAAD